MKNQAFSIGLDFGTDSVRGVLMGNDDGNIVASSECFYPRWARKLYCQPQRSIFRQHPLDYIEGLTDVIRDIVNGVPVEICEKISGLSLGTTGSTPIAVNKKGTPLALLPEFSGNPNAMFLLWKDHSAWKEANEINELNKGLENDYLRFVGGSYSSEWFWAKLLYVLRIDEEIRDAIYSWVEHCDWLPFLLTGGSDVSQMKRSRCTAGHKALWSEEFDGLPLEFLNKVDPLLKLFNDRLYVESFTADMPVGTLSQEWANKLGLPANIKVGVGALDAHFAAVGAGIEPYQLCKVMGTSTCDMIVVPSGSIQIEVKGISGQVEGSILPGMIGLEAGQSAFGDIFNWFVDLLSWQFEQDLNPDDQKSKSEILKSLGDAASKIPLEPELEIATDWFNGRRSPFAANSLKATISGLHIGSSAPRVFRSLIEAACFGSKRIMEQYEEEGVPIKSITAMGGVANKADFIMQMMANILELPIDIVADDQVAARGAALFAATASGHHNSIEDAIQSSGAKKEKSYQPNHETFSIYRTRYEKYKSLCKMTS